MASVFRAFRGWAPFQTAVQGAFPELELAPEPCKYQPGVWLHSGPISCEGILQPSTAMCTLQSFCNTQKQNAFQYLKAWVTFRRWNLSFGPSPTRILLASARFGCGFLRVPSLGGGDSFLGNHREHAGNAKMQGVPIPLVTPLWPWRWIPLGCRG